MNILQLGKFYPIRGGVEKVMYDLTLGLSERKVHCDMLCASTEDYPAETIKLNAYGEVMVLPTRLKLAATMLAPKMILKLRRIAKYYDIIHIHHPDPMACLALFLSGYKGKVVLHWHSDILKQKTLLKLYAPLQTWLIRRADSIVGTTPVYVAESPFLQNVKHKISYIPIGVSPLKSDKEEVAHIRERYGHKHLIFSLGRLVEYKGYEYLIRAVADLEDGFHLLIGGKGPLKTSLEALIQKLGVKDRVTLLGFIPDEEIANYYDATDIFCLSSIRKTEAFAIVQIEAMSFGKPIISTHIPGSGVSWVNKDGVSGLVVERENPEVLAHAINKITADPVLKRQLSEGSRKRYEAYFTRHKMVEKSLEVYDRLRKIENYEYE
ncbi:glycosyltransferase [Sphingobacterium haloxyli]|uniref:Glycosyl transferase family 1 n=1 Tax=Sphingobacterium haloxyli TaxID=2100533 RepID=A0A2S9J648_9SPHI|nr:glycosyltransferase [Sphingobacterium haloxyli]PRD48219.1 glycosyl transferase family 1 [Sphingobacterium haloxyli]